MYGSSYMEWSLTLLPWTSVRTAKRALLFFHFVLYCTCRIISTLSVLTCEVFASLTSIIVFHRLLTAILVSCVSVTRLHRNVCCIWTATEEPPRRWASRCCPWRRKLSVPHAVRIDLRRHRQVDGVASSNSRWTDTEFVIIRPAQPMAWSLQHSWRRYNMHHLQQAGPYGRNNVVNLLSLCYAEIFWEITTVCIMPLPSRARHRPYCFPYQAAKIWN